jgi:hypothetical protein
VFAAVAVIVAGGNVVVAMGCGRLLVRGFGLLDAGVALDGREGLPGDAQDDQRDDEADDRVADLEPEGHDDRAGDDAQADVAVGPGVGAVGDQRGAVEPVPGAGADLGRDLVADEADDAGGRERPQPLLRRGLFSQR